MIKEKKIHATWIQSARLVTDKRVAKRTADIVGVKHKRVKTESSGHISRVSLNEVQSFFTILANNIKIYRIIPGLIFNFDEVMVEEKYRENKEAYWVPLDTNEEEDEDWESLVALVVGIVKI